MGEGGELVKGLIIKLRTAWAHKQVGLYTGGGVGLYTGFYGSLRENKLFKLIYFECNFNANMLLNKIL